MGRVHLLRMAIPVAATFFLAIQSACPGGNLTREPSDSKVTWAPTTGQNAGVPGPTGVHRGSFSPSTALPAAGLRGSPGGPAANAVPARNMLDARDSERNARAVKQDIEWSNSLADAKQRAREQGKLVFWVHMLGKIDGAT